MSQESRLAIVIDSSRARVSVEEMTRTLRHLESMGVRVTGQTETMGKAMQKMSTDVDSAAQSIRRGVTAALGGLSVMKVIDIADSWGEFNSRIRMATESMEEYEKVQKRMLTSANATYRNINETREAFIQLSPVLRQMGMSLEQSMDAIDAFSGLMVTNAASTERGAAAMRALSVSLQKGKMDADQWITIYSTLDSIVDTLAAHSGMAAEEIRKLGAEGKLSVRMIAEALAGQLEPIMAQVEEMPTTVRDALQRVGNEFGEYIGTANDAHGATAAMVTGIEVLADNLQNVLNVAFVAGTAAMARYSVGMGVSIAQTAAKAIQTRATAAAELRLAEAQAAAAAASFAQTRAMAGLTATMAQQAAAANALASAELRVAAAKAGVTAAGRSLLSILGGPVGVAMTAGLVATAFMTMGGAARGASVDVDALKGSAEDASKAFAKLGTLSRQAAIGTLSAELASEMTKASKAIDDFAANIEPSREKGARAVAGMRTDMQNELKMLVANVRESGGDVEQAVSGLIDRWEASGQISAENAATLRALGVVISSTSGTVVELGQRVQTLTEEHQNLEAATRGAAGSQRDLNDAMAGFSGATGDYLKRLQERTAAMQDGNSAVKQAERYLAGLTDVSDAYRTAVMSQAYAQDAMRAAQEKANKTTKLATSAINEAKKAAEAFERSRRQYLNGLYGEISALQDQARGLEDQIALYGLAESAKYDLAIADLEAQKAALAVIDAGAEEIAILERKIELLQQMKGSQQTLERLDAEKQAWETWSRDVEQIFGRVGQSLTDKIVDGGFKARDLLKDIFKAVTFNVLINPVMGAMQGWVTNQLGGLFGVQNPQQQSGGGFSFGGGSTFGAGAVSDLGGWMAGSSVQSVSDLGAKMVMSADKIAQIGGNVLGYGSAIYDLSQGKYASAALTAAGQAIGGPPLAMVGNFVGGVIDGFFDREPTTRREQRTQVEYAGGLFDITKTDDRAPAGADAAARALAEQAVQTANDIFRQVGVDAAIDSFHAIMASSYKGDRDGVASGGMLRLGDEYRQFGIDLNDPNPTIQGFGGWSSAETLPRLATDIQLSVLEAFQSLSDELPNVLSAMLEGIDVRSLGEAEAQALAERFTMLTQGASQFLAAIETMPFAELRDLSFDAAAGMVQFAGGLDNLLTAQQTYYERFYSDAERHAHSVDQIAEALAGVGVEMPALVGSTDDMLASYRALVEAQDLNTEAGQQAYVTLMQTAGAFADVAQFAGQAAVESQRLADQQRQAMQALRQSFVGLAGDALAAIQQHGQERIAKLSESFARTDAVFNAYRSQVQQLESQWGSLITTMQRSMRDLRGQVEASARLQYNQARAVISTAVLTGKLPQTADLGEAIRVAQQGVTGGRYASEFDQREAYLKLANELEALQGIAQPELDAARASLAQLEKQYNRLRGIEDLSGLSLKQLEKQFAVALSAEEAARTQIEQIERQITMAQLQYQQLVGINQELSTLPAALNALAKAIESARAVQEAAGPNLGDRATRYLADNPDVLNAYLAGYGKGQTAEQFALEHYNKYGRAEGRAFARGGFAVPGWALVGEEGPELVNFSQPGRVYTASQTNDILRSMGAAQSGSSQREIVAELRQTREENRKLAQYNYHMLKELIRIKNNTEDTAMAVAHNPSDDLVLVF